MPSVLFICAANCCRSPMAEAVFAHVVRQKGQDGKWTYDSGAITDTHIGKMPEPRTMKVLEHNGIQYSHLGRQIRKEDFYKFDYIFGMDDRIMTALKKRAPQGSTAKIELLGSFDPMGEEQMRDPYHDTDEIGFHKCYEHCLRCCTAFIDSVM